LFLECAGIQFVFQETEAAELSLGSRSMHIGGMVSILASSASSHGKCR